MNRQRTTERNGTAVAATTGFTLVEMLVALAAVGLIAIGIAGLFERTGDTVRAGRRIAALNEFAVTFERTMRADIEGMSRAGFLAIQHRLVPEVGDDGRAALVGLNADDLSPRERRVDSIMFFREGRFTTQRDPLHPSRTAVGPAARVYWGHGLPQELSVSGNQNAYTPALYDSNDAGPTSRRAPMFGEEGPSQYAGLWILARHETVLVPPRLTESPLARSGAGFPTAGRWADSRFQIGLQPAALDVFRIFSEYPEGAPGFPAELLPPSDELVRPVQGALAGLPKFASGIVDLASTDLSAIRARVLGVQPIGYREADRQSALRDLERIREIDPQDTTQTRAAPFALQRPDLSNSRPFSPNLARAAGPGNPAVLISQDPARIADPVTQESPVPVAARMKAWMLDAFPANPYEVDRGGIELRMRCEPSPPDLLGTVAGTSPWPDDEPWRRTDQYMLSASNFAVGCTEFIVEWSYGKFYPTTGANAPTDPNLRGRMIWHGLPRRIDTDGDPLFRPDLLAAHPYNSADSAQRVVFEDYDADAHGASPATGAGRYPRGFADLAAANNRTSKHVFETALIHEPAPRTSSQWDYPAVSDPLPGSPTRLFSLFGYVDPTFAWTDPDADDVRDREPLPGEPSEAPVPWPKLIRVTMSLVDASEPLREQTYQFVFRVPPARGDAN